MEQKDIHGPTGKKGEASGKAGLEIYDFDSENPGRGDDRGGEAFIRQKKGPSEPLYFKFRWG
jgi:hypothetical protein